MVKFNDDMVAILEKYYHEKSKHPKGEECTQLSTSLGLTETQVNGWFNRRRFKDRHTNKPSTTETKTTKPIDLIQKKQNLTQQHSLHHHHHHHQMQQQQQQQQQIFGLHYQNKTPTAAAAVPLPPSAIIANTNMMNIGTPPLSSTDSTPTNTTPPTITFDENVGIPTVEDVSKLSKLLVSIFNNDKANPPPRETLTVQRMKLINTILNTKDQQILQRAADEKKLVSVLAFWLSDARKSNNVELCLPLLTLFSNLPLGFETVRDTKVGRLAKEFTKGNFSPQLKSSAEGLMIKWSTLVPSGGPPSIERNLSGSSVSSDTQGKKRDREGSLGEADGLKKKVRPLSATVKPERRYSGDKPNNGTEASSRAQHLKRSRVDDITSSSFSDNNAARKKTAVEKPSYDILKEFAQKAALPKIRRAEKVASNDTEASDDTATTPTTTTTTAAPTTATTSENEDATPAVGESNFPSLPKNLAGGLASIPTIKKLEPVEEPNGLVTGKKGIPSTRVKKDESGGGVGSSPTGSTTPPGVASPVESSFSAIKMIESTRSYRKTTNDNESTPDVSGGGDSTGAGGSSASGSKRRVTWATKLEHVKLFYTEEEYDSSEEDQGDDGSGSGRKAPPLVEVLEWYTPIELFIEDSSLVEGEESKEKDIQQDRERQSLGVDYYTDEDIPWTPDESTVDRAPYSDGDIPVIPYFDPYDVKSGAAGSNNNSSSSSSSTGNLYQQSQQPLQQQPLQQPAAALGGFDVSQLVNLLRSANSSAAAPPPPPPVAAPIQPAVIPQIQPLIPQVQPQQQLPGGTSALLQHFLQQQQRQQHQSGQNSLFSALQGSLASLSNPQQQPQPQQQQNQNRHPPGRHRQHHR